MYKISKAKSNRFVNSLIHVPKQGIQSPSTTFYKFKNSDYEKLNFYHVYGEQKASVGFFYLNRPQKYNVLSAKMCGEIKRFLESFNLDETIRGMWMETNGSDFFSAGTDYLQLAHHVKNREDHKAFEYLRNVNDLGLTLGKFNKPLIVNLNGKINNSAASMFSVLPHVLAGKKTKWSLNQTRIGYIPDCGASYFLSRLPGEIGTYLALTGAVLSGEDLVHLNMAYLNIYGDEQRIKGEFEEANNGTEEALNSREMYGNERVKLRTEKKRVVEGMNKQLTQEIRQRIENNQENAKLVLSEVIYKRKLVDYVNHHFDETNSKNYTPQRVMNHLKFYEDQVLSPAMLSLYPNNDRFEPNLNTDAINRCYAGQTIEEIFDNLKRENTEWAREQLALLQSKSPLSLKLSLRLVREGINSEWADCYAKEFRVACRRIKDEEFLDAVANVLKNKDKSFSGWKYNTPENVSASLVDSYFQPLSDDLKIDELDHGIKQHSLYPTKDFYKQYPDLVRFYLNEESVNNPFRREEGDFTVKEFLISRGIDYRNYSASVDKVRKHFYNVERQKKRIEKENERLAELCGSSQNMKNYLESRKASIESRFSDENEMKGCVQRTVNSIFDKFLAERLENFQCASKELQNEEKKKFFLDVKNIILTNRLSTSTQSKLEEQAELQSSINLPLFFPEDNTKSFLNVANPKYKDHPLSETISMIKRKMMPNPLNTSDRIVEPTRYVIEYEKEKILKEGNQEIIINTEEIGERDRARDEIKRFMRKGEKEEKDFYKYYTERLISAGSSHGSIQKFLSEFSSKEIEQFLKESQIETVEQNRRSFIETLEKNNKQTNDLFESKNAETLKDSYKSTLDFYVKKDASSDNLWGYLDFNKKEDNMGLCDGLPKSDENLEHQLYNFIKTDQKLDEMLGVFFQPRKDKSVERMRKTFLSILLSVYHDRIKRTLKSEYTQGLISPLVSRNGKGGISQKESHNYMRLIDDFLRRSIQNEFHSMISGQLFFSFGYLGLLELERVFQLFQRASNLPGVSGQQEEGGQEAQVINFLRGNKIEIGSLADLEPILNFLNDLTEKCCALFYLFKEDLHSPEERLIELLGTSEVLHRRKFRRTFVQHALESFQDKLFLESEKEKKIVEKYTLQKEPIRLDTLANVLNYKRDDYHGNFELLDKDVENAVRQFESYREKKRLIEGSIIYLRKLDQLTLRAIKGELNFAPEKDLVQEELSQIPNLFETFDIRKPAGAWLQERLEKYIRSLFEIRFTVEKNLPKNELLALDYEILKYLDVEKLKTAMINELDQDMSILNFLGDILERRKLGAMNEDFQESKYENYAKKFEESIKNPEALNKLLAFGMMLQNKYQIQKQHENVEFMFKEMEILNRLEKEVSERPKPMDGTEQQIQDIYKEFFQIDKIEKGNQEQNMKFLEMKKNSETPYKDELIIILKDLIKEKRELNKTDDVLKGELENFFARFSDKL